MKNLTPRQTRFLPFAEPSLFRLTHIADMHAFSDSYCTLQGIISPRENILKRETDLIETSKISYLQRGPREGLYYSVF